MRSTMVRNGLVAVLTTAALGAGSTVSFAEDAPQNAAATATQGTAATATPSAYINRLSWDIAKATAKGEDVTDEQQVLAQFRALSLEDQKEYLGYLNDPKVLQAFFDSREVSNDDPKALISKDATTKYNKDVSFESGGALEHESGDAAGDASGVSSLVHWTDKATYTDKMKIHGITVTKLVVWVRYEATRNAITKALNSGSAKRNFNFGVVISSDNAKPWIGGNRAHAETVWQGNITYTLWTAQIDKIQSLSASWDGSWKGTIRNA
ncbi:hypothetical protein ACFWJM_11090 [Streptomyces sp. NPDC127077]|uniref:hypothetical protein n=1 Tax=Streptomyces sp. NPDC127077 TaxID=3347131 RepID=UPI00365CD50A